MVDEETGSEITIIPSDEYQVTTMVDFGTKVLGTQNATLQHLSDFKKDISDSRTFSFLHELEMLLESGLIKGGDLNNAIVYVDKPLSEETMERLKKAFNKFKEEFPKKKYGIFGKKIDEKDHSFTINKKDFSEIEERLKDGKRKEEGR